MAERLSGALGAPSQGKEILGPPDIARSLFRIAHEILERNHGTQDIVVLGIPSGGAPLAHRLVEALAVASAEGTQWSKQAGQAQTADAKVPVGTLDITMYRDDLGRHPIRVPRPTEIPQGGIDGKVVILVDDVLYSGGLCSPTLNGPPRRRSRQWPRNGSAPDGSRSRTCFAPTNRP